jgi:multidrug efflux pump subunit AcrB
VIVRSTFDGPLIRVRDVARVYDGFEPEKTRFRIMGKESISLTVFKKETADVIRLVDAVKEVVEKERIRVPAGVELLYTDDNSIFVRNRLRIVSTNALIGLTLVVILLFTFLNFRTALWVAMGIPLSVSGVFFLSPFFGVYIDAIALAGMVIVVGLIVDDAIVIAENIYRHREMGEPPLVAAVEGTYKVFRPVLTTIVTTILAFAPMFFMTGIIGKFIFPIPLVMTLALLISFFVTILPAHISAGKDKRVLKNPSEGEKKDTGAAGSNWFDGVRSRFQQFVVYVLRLRYLVIAIFFLLLAGSFLYASHFMKFILFPSSSAEKFFVLVETPTGTSLNATADRVKEIEKIMSGLPEDEMESIWTLNGSMEGFIMGENENWALISVSLTPYSDRERNAEEIVDSLRQKTDKLTGFASIRYVIDAGGPPVGRPITIRVVGSDNQLRKDLADSVEKYLASIKGVTDIDRDDKLGKEQVELKINYERLSQLGLTVEDLALGVRLAYDGEVVTSVRYGDEDVDFRVILEKMARREPGYLRSLNIPNRQGRLIPLKEVAGFTTGPGPSSFYHFDGERTITITADIAKGGLTPLEATRAVIDHFDLDNDWPGMRFEIGGEAEETQKSMKSLAIAMVTSAVGIYFILVLLFNSLTQPILVMFAIPFGLIGVIGAFAAHGEPLGFLAMLGVIGLMGVVVNDSLILVDYINVHRIEEPEKKFLRIVAEGTSARLRPILLTSVTTVSGVLPMAYGLGGSDPFLAPMALALGYGILFATPLTLLLLPCLYMIPNDIREIAAWVRRIIARKGRGSGIEDTGSRGK